VQEGRNALCRYHSATLKGTAGMAASPQEHPLVLERSGAVARIRLDRPTLHNAFDAGLIADYAERNDLSLPKLDAGQVDELAQVLPVYANLVNPLDFTTAIWGDGAALERMLDSALRSEADAVKSARLLRTTSASRPSRRISSFGTPKNEVEPAEPDESEPSRRPLMKSAKSMFSV
jgi:hypothetical protein